MSAALPQQLQPTSDDLVDAVMRSCLDAPSPQSLKQLRNLLTGERISWGALIEHAACQGTLCLLACTLSRIDSGELAPYAITALLDQQLRAAQHVAAIERRHAAALAQAAKRVGIHLAAIDAIAVEQYLYDGTGARPIDEITFVTSPGSLGNATALLHSLGFQLPRTRPADVLTAELSNRDQLRPVTRVRILATLPGFGSAALDAMFERCLRQPVIGDSDAYLTVPNPRDYDRYLRSVIDQDVLARADRARLLAIYPRLDPQSSSEQ